MLYSRKKTTTNSNKILRYKKPYNRLDYKVFYKLYRFFKIFLLNFKIKANDTVGIVGKSGSGKTTIFNLLTKLYTLNEGKITIDGININELSEDTIRKNISVISQTPYIFNMSIKDDLKLIKADLEDEEMIEKSKMTGLHDFVVGFKDGYDTIVGEGAVMLSGGQRQRLAITRALIKDSEIILLDEATSALDNKTQAHVYDSIRKISKDYTILIIAHRLSTIKECNKIMFVSDGRVIAIGTHENLMSSCIEYKNLYEKELIE